MIGLWFLVDYFFKLSIHQIILPAIFIIINLLSYKFKIFASIERDKKNHPGTIYFAIAITVLATISYIWPETYDYVYFGVASLTLGDGAASLFGTIFNSKKIRRNKSLIGTIACILATLISFIPYYIYKSANVFPFYNLISISLVVGFVELIGYGLDNFSTCFTGFILPFLCFKLGSSFQIAILIAIVVSYLVYFLHLINYKGTILTFFITLSFFYFGGIRSIIVLGSSYLVSVACSVYLHIKNIKNEIVKKSGRRDAMQIAANGLIPTIFIIIYGIAKLDLFMIVAWVGIAANLSDTVASDIGITSKKDPISIIGFKPVSKGTSGGISLLGFLSSGIVSLVFAIIFTIMATIKVWFIPILFVLIMIGNIVDSILGATIQAKYECVKCGIETEKNYHCGVPTVLKKGISFVNNDFVNFSCSAVSSFFAIVVFTLLL